MLCWVCGAALKGSRPTMSKHHHHPNEGHSEGEPPRAARDHLHHNWFFYVAGFFILVALIGFILAGSPAWQLTAAPAQPVSSSVSGR